MQTEKPQLDLPEVKDKEMKKEDVRFNEPKMSEEKDLQKDEKGDEAKKQEVKDLNIKDIDLRSNEPKSEGKQELKPEEEKDRELSSHKTEELNPLSLWDLDVFNISDSFNNLHKAFIKRFENFDKEMEESRLKALKKWKKNKEVSAKDHTYSK